MIKRVSLILIFTFMLTVFANAQERIKFRKGTTRTKVSGFLGCDDPKDYIIGGRQGQKMSITLWSKGATATVVDNRGNRTAMSDDSQSMTYWFQYSGDVRIVLLKPCGGATGYDLKVSIR